MLSHIFINYRLSTLRKTTVLFVHQYGTDTPLGSYTMSQTSRDRDNSRCVRTHEKNSGETVRRLATIIQSIFCAQSGGGICLNGNSLVRHHNSRPSSLNFEGFQNKSIRKLHVAGLQQVINYLLSSRFLDPIVFYFCVNFVEISKHL